MYRRMTATMTPAASITTTTTTPTITSSTSILRRASSCASTISLSTDSSSTNSSRSSKHMRVVRFADDATHQVIVLEADAAYDEQRRLDREDFAARKERRRQEAEQCRRQGFGFLLMDSLVLLDQQQQQQQLQNSFHDDAASTGGGSTTAATAVRSSPQRHVNVFVRLPEPYYGRGLERQISKRHDWERKEIMTTCVQNVLEEENRLRLARQHRRIYGNSANSNSNNTRRGSMDSTRSSSSRKQQSQQSEDLSDDQIWQALAKVSRDASRSSRRFARRMGKADELVVKQGELKDAEKARALIDEIKTQQRQEHLLTKSSIYTLGSRSHPYTNTNNNNNSPRSRDQVYSQYDSLSLSLAHQIRQNHANRRASYSGPICRTETTNARPSIRQVMDGNQSLSKLETSSELRLSDKKSASDRCLLPPEDLDDDETSTASNITKSAPPSSKSKSSTKRFLRRWGSFRKSANEKAPETNGQQNDKNEKPTSTTEFMAMMKHAVSRRHSDIHSAAAIAMAGMTPPSPSGPRSLLQRCFSWKVSDNQSSNSKNLDTRNALDMPNNNNKSNSNSPRRRRENNSGDPFEGTSMGCLEDNEDDMEESMRLGDITAEKDGCTVAESYMVGGLNDSLQINRTRIQPAPPTTLERRTSLSTMPPLEERDHSGHGSSHDTQSNNGSSTLLASSCSGGDTSLPSKKNFAATCDSSNNDSWNFDLLADDDDDNDTLTVTATRRTDDWKPQAPPATRWSNSMSALGTVMESAPRMESLLGPGSAGSLSRSTSALQVGTWNNDDDDEDEVLPPPPLSLTHAASLGAGATTASPTRGDGRSRGISRRKSSSALFNSGESNSRGEAKRTGKLKKFLSR